MQKDILINSGAHERRIAVLEDGRLEEFLMERPDKERMVGNIYVGVVQRVHPGMQAAFVDIGLGKAAFLSADDVELSGVLDPVDTEDGADVRRHRGGPNIGRLLHKNQRILVQVTKEPIGTKGARITMQLSFPGRFIVLLTGTDFIGISKKTRDSFERKNLRGFIASVKPEGVGIIVRTIGLMAHEEDFRNEINIQYDKYRRTLAAAQKARGPALVHREIGLGASAIRDLFAHDVSRVIVDSKPEYKDIMAYLKEVDPDMRGRVQLYSGRDPLFDVYEIEREVDKILRRKVWLKSGGYLIFDHTEALVAIDVNSGRFVSGSQENTIFRTNLEAVGEVARQLRLRDIGGLIIIDLIDMDNPRHREQIYQEFCRAMLRDKAAHHVGRISEFGLIELSRKRVRPELVTAMSEVCPTCGGMGTLFATSVVTARINRFLNRNRAAKGERRLQLEVPTAIADYLESNKGEVFKRLAKENDSKIELLVNEELHSDEFRIYNAKTGEDLTEKLREGGAQE